MNKLQETRSLVANALLDAGFDIWLTKVTKHVRTNATIGEARKVLCEYGYSVDIVQANSAYSKSATGEFVTIVKIV